jgi:Xaa-Pro aminopeptidase
LPFGKEKLTKERAYEVTGIKTVYLLQDFEKVLFEMMTHCDTIYINTNEHYRATVETETREARFVKWWKDKYPAHVCQSNPILQRLRSVKETEELDLIQKSLYITELGFRRILPLKPNVTEYEIEAELIHEFIRNRSRGFAYTPIIARKQCQCAALY